LTTNNKQEKKNPFDEKIKPAFDDIEEIGLEI